MNKTYRHCAAEPKGRASVSRAALKGCILDICEVPVMMNSPAAIRLIHVRAGELFKPRSMKTSERKMEVRQITLIPAAFAQKRESAIQ